MSREQSWRLGRTFTVVALIMWLFVESLNSVPFTLIWIAIASAGLWLIVRGER